MNGNNVTPESTDARGEYNDPLECTHFTHQDCSYDIRAAISTIEDRTVFLNAILTIGKAYDTHIICFNADMLAGMRHAHTAMRHALRSYNVNAMISKTLEMEALLYASGSRQCSLAAHFGVHQGENHLYVCCYPKCDTVWDALTPVVQIVDDSWSGINSQKRASLVKLFDITGDELSTIQGDHFIELVLERIALLEVYR